jgi:hypothetical protein
MLVELPLEFALLISFHDKADFAGCKIVAQLVILEH